MIRKLLISLGVLTFLFVVTTVVFGVTASYNSTIRIVSSAGTVLDGVASAVTASYNSTVQVVDSTGHVIDSFSSGAPTGAAGGVLGGTYPNPAFNSTTATGNEMDNSLFINNTSGFGALNPTVVGDWLLGFDTTNGYDSMVVEDRLYYKVANLPGSCGGTPTPAPAVVDATVACTNAVAPTGGGTNICTVTCQTGVYKMNGTAPDGPGYMAVANDGTVGLSFALGPYNATGLGSNLGGTLTCYSHQSTTAPDTCRIAYKLSLSGTTSGALFIAAPAVSNTITWTAPNVTTTEPTANPGTSGMALTATTAGVRSYAAMESPGPSISGLLGANSSTAAATLLVSCDTMVRAGHFTMLSCVDDFLTACTTAPAFNIRNNTTTTTGTAKTCGNTAGQVTQAETLTFAAGDQVCLVRTGNGGTCTAPTFAVTTHVSFP